MIDPIPFHRPDLDSDDRKAMRDVLASGWLTTGKEAAAFEQEFAHIVGAQVAVAVSSGTAALHLACVLAGLNHAKHEVIVPTLTFTATAGAVLQAGATPVLADVDPDTFGLSVATIAARRTKRTVAVVPVLYAGNPAGLDEVITDAHRQVPRYTVIEDAAHAYPARLVDGTMIGGQTGSFATCFSFYPTKPITTVEGGMLVLADPSLEPLARRLSYHGIHAQDPPHARRGLDTDLVTDEGFKYNLPDLLAALGRSQLRKADVLAGRRQIIAERYRSRLTSLVEAGLLRVPRVDPAVKSAWQLYVIRFALDRLRPEWTRDRLAIALAERGVHTSLRYRPLHTQPFWRARLESAQWGEFPIADKIAASALCLPIWPGMTESQVDQVADEVGRLVKSVAR
jgi:dTDP-4-amino-4,6-dideoxygalactose transaminase